jgi:hypothetical protein
MGGIVVGIVVVIIVAIVWLSRGSTEKHTEGMTREEFLKRLEKFTSGKMQPMVGLFGAFQIMFRSDERDFVYEDIEEKGFDKVDHKGYLRVKSQTLFTLLFNTKQGAAILGDSSRLSKGTTLGLNNIPASFTNFDIVTNNTAFTNSMFRDPRILRILDGFINEDFRGSTFSALKIQDGIITLEIYSAHNYQPSMVSLREDMNLFETYVNRLMILVDKIEKQRDDKNE